MLLPKDVDTGRLNRRLLGTSQRTVTLTDPAKLIDINLSDVSGVDSVNPRAEPSDFAIASAGNDQLSAPRRPELTLSTQVRLTISLGRDARFLVRRLVPIADEGLEDIINEINENDKNIPILQQLADMYALDGDDREAVLALRTEKERTKRFLDAAIERDSPKIFKRLYQLEKTHNLKIADDMLGSLGSLMVDDKTSTVMNSVLHSIGGKQDDVSFKEKQFGTLVDVLSNLPEKNNEDILSEKDLVAILTAVLKSQFVGGQQARDWVKLLGEQKDSQVKEWAVGQLAKQKTAEETRSMIDAFQGIYEAIKLAENKSIRDGENEVLRLIKESNTKRQSRLENLDDQLESLKNGSLAKNIRQRKIEIRKKINKEKKKGRKIKKNKKNNKEKTTLGTDGKLQNLENESLAKKNEIDSQISEVRRQAEQELSEIHSQKNNYVQIARKEYAVISRTMKAAYDDYQELSKVTDGVGRSSLYHLAKIYDNASSLAALIKEVGIERMPNLVDDLGKGEAGAKELKRRIKFLGLTSFSSLVKSDIQVEVTEKLIKVLDDKKYADSETGLEKFDIAKMFASQKSFIALINVLTIFDPIGAKSLLSSLNANELAILASNPSNTKTLKKLYTNEVSIQNLKNFAVKFDRLGKIYDIDQASSVSGMLKTLDVDEMLSLFESESKSFSNRELADIVKLVPDKDAVDAVFSLKRSMDYSLADLKGFVTAVSIPRSSNKLKKQAAKSARDEADGEDGKISEGRLALMLEQGLASVQWTEKFQTVQEKTGGGDTNEWVVYLLSNTDQFETYSHWVIHSHREKGVSRSEAPATAHIKRYKDRKKKEAKRWNINSQLAKTIRDMATPTR